MVAEIHQRTHTGNLPDRSIGRILWCAFALFMMVQPACAESLRIRLAWGGGEHATWKGSISLSAGKFSRPRSLGSEPDAVRSIWIDQNVLSIQSPRPINYQAIDIDVDAPLTAQLQCELSGETVTDGPRRLSIPLADIVKEPFNQPIDEAGNRMLVRRVPGDELRISTAVDQLVFSPGTTWRVTVQPHLLALTDTAHRQLVARLVAAHPSSNRSPLTLWKQEHRIELHGENQSIAAVDFDVPIPTVEGVYDLMISVSSPRKRLFRTGMKESERRVQFVVVSPEPQTPAPGTAVWRELVSFDASQPQWWDRLAQLPSWQRFAITPRGLRGQGTAQPADIDGQSVNRLEPGGWQTYPLPVLTVNTPHALEVTYGGERPQLLGVSIIEPKVDRSRLQTLDHAIRVEPPVWNEDEQTCRIVFWPRTRMPAVLLTNLSSEIAAEYQAIRLFEGPQALPPSGPVQRQRGFRQVFAKWNSPDFYKSFSAPLSVDPISQHGLTDWQTFYDGALRMAEYLHHARYDGTVIACLDGGAAICPIDTDTTPRFDSGAYFETGQDPMPKDVLELVHRIFDREQLQLTLGVRFSTPIRELESRLRQAPHEIALRNAAGEEYRAHVDFPNGEGAHYNPLDPTVQKDVLRLIRRLVLRYGHHPSFAGIQLELGPSSFLCFPGSEWGLDPATVARFRSDMRATIAQVAQQANISNDPANLLQEPLQSIWIQWRAAQLSHFYRQIANEITAVRPDARLSLSLGTLADQGLIHSTCHPALPRPASVAAALMAKGLDVVELAQIDGIDVARPLADTTADNWDARGSRFEYRSASVWNSLTSQAANQVSAVENATWHFQSQPFDEAQLFGPDIGNTRFAFQMIGDDKHDAREYALTLARSDSQQIFNGGKQLSLTQSDRVTRWLDAFRLLPDSRFENVRPSDSGSNGAPVVVRYLPQAGKTYFYAVNNSPWSVQTRIQFQAPDKCVCSPLALHTDEQSFHWNRTSTNAPRDNITPITEDDLSPVQGNWTWSRQLEPYELVTAVINDDQAIPVSVTSQLPPEVPAEMQRLLNEVGSRLRALKSQPAPYDGLKNAGFEEHHQTPTGADHWDGSTSANTQVRRAEQFAFAGRASLQLTSRQGVAWVRSAPLAAPQSGRLSLQVRIRTNHRLNSPLRLALEGIYQGQPYYRFAEVQPQSTPAQEWSKFVLQVNDLPQSGLTDLRIRFDLMGPGDVWLDDVQLFDLALSTDEQIQLSKIVGLADFQLRQGKFADCERTLRGYWPQYLIRVVPPQVKRIATLPPSIDIPPTNPRARPQKENSLLNRVRNILPRF